MAINLFINSYFESNIYKQQDNDDAIENNIDNPYLDVIPVLNFWDTGKPSYKQMLEIVNKCSEPDDINIITNSTDIYFDESIKLVTQHIKEEFIYVLNAHIKSNMDNEAIIDTQNDPDAFIFLGHMPEDFIYFLPENYILLGSYGSGRRMVHDFTEAGFLVLNPSHSVKCYKNLGQNPWMKKEPQNILDITWGPYMKILPNLIGCMYYNPV